MPGEGRATREEFMLHKNLHKSSFSRNMKSLDDARAVRNAARSQRGVFSKADLQILLVDPHPASFVRRITALLKADELHRFCRGWYVHAPFDLETLCQRIAPTSYVSFGTVLAHELLIGTRPERQVIAVTTGRSARYSGLDHEIVFVHIAKHLDFGYAPRGGVRYADAEKAMLDALYFHLRGRRYPFDIYSDVDYSRLDRNKVASYLERYRNPKFVAFARGVLKEHLEGA